MSDAEQQIPQADIVEQSAKSTVPENADATALSEGRAIREGNYDDADAGDSYGVRQALKGQVKAKAWWIFNAIFFLVIILLLGYLVMGGCYVWHLASNPKEMREVLKDTFTHLLAGGLGFFAWAWFGPKAKGR